MESASEMGHEFEAEAGYKFLGCGASIKLKSGSTANIGGGVSYGSEWESGQSTEQSVGFILNDDDVGDNYCTRVYADPRWGTPIFFQDSGSISSDPWEKGTNKAVDVTMEMVKDTEGRFDYHEGAHYKVKLTYTGQRKLESSGINFLLYDTIADNKDGLTVRFNGNEGPFMVELSKESPNATIVISVYPPEVDQDNSEEKQYSVNIGVIEEADDQIGRSITLNTKFADMRAPRAIITSPYAGQRVSPALFPVDDPFKVKVVSGDMDIASIQLQIRSKQPDGVMEPWQNLSGMKWEGTNTAVVTLFEYLDRVPLRREFTFKWTEAEIKVLGVGEYSLRAVAVDKATKPNTDLDPPDVVFLVDESKPSVLCSIPDYQASEAERIYRGELSVLFTDDMRAMDFTDRTFYVMDLLNNNEKVAGYVSYSPALRKAIFVPIVPFTPYGFYRVEIKTDEEKPDHTIEQGVHDLAGNPLDNAFMWTFRTKDAPFEQVWSIGLSVTDGISLDGNNIAGVEYGATDGTDEKDAQSVPGMASQMRLSYLNKQRQGFDRDIRPADGRLSHHWFFVIDNAKRYTTVTLSWQPSLLLTKSTRQYQTMRLVEFDANNNVTNNIVLDPSQVKINPQTGEMESTEIYSYVNKGELSRYFRLDVQKENFVAKSFKKGSSGWKLFSVPVTPQRAEPFVNLGDDIDPFKLYQYETKLGGYKVYPLDIGEVSLQTRYGYWTQIEKDVEVDVGGASNFNDMELELNFVGWQAIGNPFILPVNVADLDVREGTSAAVSFDQAVAAGLIEGTLYRWDIVTQEEAYASKVSISDSYEAITNSSKLEPWEGYWLKTKKPNITLIIPAPPGIGTATVEMPDSFKPPRAPRLNRQISMSPSPQFSFCVEVFSDGALDRSTILGTNQEAKPGQDALDSTEPPVMGQTVAAYFEHSDWGEAAGMYNQDCQPAMDVGEQRTWQLTVYTDKPNALMTVSWEKAIRQVPSDIMLSFRKVGETTWQDMRQTNKVEFTSDTRLIELKFEIQAERIKKAIPLALAGDTLAIALLSKPIPNRGLVSL
ncbi:hypothetical protein KKE26_12075 [bacterium]|nr:hypothetical protein [bacterium]